MTKSFKKNVKQKNIFFYSPNFSGSERAFSITGQFANKLWTKLDDDTLSSLVFLKAFYNNEASN